MPDTPLFELAVKSPAGCGDRNDRYPRVAIDRNKPPGSQRSQRSQPALLCDRCDRRSDHTQTQNKHTIPHTEQTHGPPTVLRASWLCCCIRLAIWGWFWSNACLPSNGCTNTKGASTSPHPRLPIDMVCSSMCMQSVKTMARVANLLMPLSWKCRPFRACCWASTGPVV